VTTSDEPVAAPAEPELDLDLDLDTIARDLAAVEEALARLDAGTYWSDEITGAPIPDDVLTVDPIARRTPSS
jgi:RNA polymerase-binding transcription factor DksA